MTSRVTVLMPVFNAAPYLREAVDSILNGSFRDLQLLAINDGSTDNSEAILHAVADPRLKILNNPKNLGLAATLNRGLDYSDSEFIVRMDADDISLPHRIARQVAFMESSRDVGVSGTWSKTIGAKRGQTLRAPAHPSEVAVQLFAYNAIGHPTAILRTAALSKHGLRFSTDTLHAEDLDLWMRASECFPIANIPIVTLRYRLHSAQVTTRFASEQLWTLNLLRRRQLLRLLPNAAEEEISLHLQLFDVNQKITFHQLQLADAWLGKLKQANASVQRYDEHAFEAFLAQRWLNAAHRCQPANLAVWRTWSKSPFASAAGPTSIWLFTKKALSF